MLDPMDCFIDREKVVKTPQELAEHLQGVFGDDLSYVDLRDFSEGSSGEVTSNHLWMTIDKTRLLDFVDELGKFDFPNFHVVSGDDEGDHISLYYHFDLYRAVERGVSLHVTVCVHVPKDDLTVDSLFSRIPGVEYSEREIQEMFGVDHIGLPNKALVFLPDDWNREVFPWRRDETAPGEDLVEDLS